jgi:hypothetical protein
MKINFFTLFLIISTITFGQKDYGFDKPWRAKSNEGVYDWFIDKLDSKCDTVVINLFKNIGVNTDSIEWIYPTTIFNEITTKGNDCYSINRYYADNQSEVVKMVHIQDGKSKLPNKYYALFYTSPSPEGKINFVLSEYY